MGKLNVAIADDNEVMRDLLEEMVTSDDELHLIGMAKDGEEACHLIREKEPDVVLLDIIMPKLDGLAVLDRIRADHTLKNRPFMRLGFRHISRDTSICGRQSSCL